MPVRIRLARFGHVHRPFYRLRVADSRAPRDGKFIEQLGTYDPLVDDNGCKTLRLNVLRTRYWLGVGAQPSDTVARLLSRFNLLPIPPKRSIFHPKDLLSINNAAQHDESQIINEVDQILDTSSADDNTTTPTSASKSSSIDTTSTTSSASSTSPSLPDILDITNERTPIAELPWQRRVRERKAHEAKLLELQRQKLIEAEKQKEAIEEERLRDEEERRAMQMRNKHGLRDTILTMLAGKQSGIIKNVTEPSTSTSTPQPGVDHPTAESASHEENEDIMVSPAAGSKSAEAMKLKPKTTDNTDSKTKS